MVPIFFSTVVPFLWLTNAYLKFGSVLYPFIAAEEMQLSYVGQMNYGMRLLIIPKVLFIDIGLIAFLGSVAFIFFYTRKDDKVLISIPAFFILLLIWISTLLGASNPYQEPRYLVFFVWTTFPLAVSLVMHLKRSAKNRFFISMLIVVIIIQNSVQLIHFQNSFEKELEKVALTIRPFCYKQSINLPIKIISNSYVEDGVLPVLSGCPQRFDHITKSQFETQFVDIVQNRSCSLIITKSKSIAKQSLIHNMDYKKVYRYFVIYCSAQNMR